MKANTNDEDDIKMFNYLMHLKYNNVDKIVNSIAQIKVVAMPDNRHNDILNNKTLLVSETIKFVGEC